jgi:hypothetical protein
MIWFVKFGADNNLDNSILLCIVILIRYFRSFLGLFIVYKQLTNNYYFSLGQFVNAKEATKTAAERHSL